MLSPYHRLEYWRFLLVLVVAVLLSIISKQWITSFLVVISLYLAWIIYKLNQLYQWLENGGKAKQLPDNSGIIEGITLQIQSMEKKSTVRKKRMGKLLKRSQRIISGLPYAAIVLNGNNEIEWANDISIQFFNIDIKKDLGQRIDNLIRLPEFRDILIKNNLHEIDLSPARSGGRKLALQLIPVQKDLKLIIARDITERENTLQMRKNFIANASHELRTPLTVISGYLEILLEEENMSEKVQSALNSATNQSMIMKGIIEDLLILSRLENSELNNDSNTVINVPKIIQGICNDEQALITDNSHLLETNIQLDLKILGAEAELISICSNLIHNAIRHTHDGTRITVNWNKKANGEACLMIKDNGQGIPAEHIPHLTERFYRVDKGRSRDKGGTGLGLAIVQHIIHRHGGRLNINSVLGKGSEFTVCLPPERVVETSLAA